MPKPKLLNGLAHDLVHSFFSTLRYCGKGYMSDWIVNAANGIGTDKIVLNVLNKTIFPKDLEIPPIMNNLKDLEKIITRSLYKADLTRDYLKKIYFEIVIFPDRCLICNTIVEGGNDRKFKTIVYKEKSFEDFKAVRLNIFDKIQNWISNKYYYYRIKLLRRHAYRKLKYTKRLENMKI